MSPNTDPNQPDTFIVNVQSATEVTHLPSEAAMTQWAQLALAPPMAQVGELSIRLVDEEESAALNKQFRHKVGPTNVLSFPYEGPAQPNYYFYGDLVLCAGIINDEAQVQQKRIYNHWAHLIIHGCLHLMGYDHIIIEEAEVMEAKEIALLKTLNIGDPYE